MLAQIYFVIVRRIVRGLVKDQGRKDAAARESIAHEGFAMESACFRCFIRGNMPFARVSAVVSGFMHQIAQQGDAGMDIGEIIDHTVLM